LQASGSNDAEQVVVLAQRHEQRRMETSELSNGLCSRIVNLRQVRNLDEAIAAKQRLKWMIWPRLVGFAKPLRQRFQIAMVGDRTEMFAVIEQQRADRHSAQAVRLLQDRIEYRP